MKSPIRRKVLAACALALGATLTTTAALAQTKEPLRFGVAMPLTGSQALFGVDFVTAAKWAVADINAKGGVEGRPLEMVVLDTQAEPQTGISAVNRLIHVDKVPVFITAWSGVVKAVAPIANREKVLALAVGANSPEIAKLGDYVYTTYPLADVDIVALAKYTSGTLGKKRAAVLYINNESGVEGARTYRTAFEKAGGEVVAFEAYDAKASDFTGQVLKVRAANPEIIHIQGLITDLPLVISQIRQLGMTQRITTYAAGYNPKLLQQLGAAAEGLIVTSLAPGAADNENVARFVERWQKTEKRVSNALPYTQYMYDAPYLVADMFGAVLKSGAPITGENMRKALLATKKYSYPMTGALEIGEDHRIKKPVYLLTVEKGKFVPMTTID